MNMNRRMVSVINTVASLLTDTPIGRQLSETADAKIYKNIDFDRRSS